MGFGLRESGFERRTPTHESGRTPDSELQLPSFCAILDADASAAAGWMLPDLADACLAGGARFLQFRAKHAAGGWFLDVATAIVARARAAGAIVIVNDRADIARLANAHGVHLGQDDLSPRAARAIVGDAAV